MLHGLDIEVYRSDRITVEQAEERNPEFIVISPGPKSPAKAGISTHIVKRLYKKIPIFGVCLGMQCINEAFGGITVRAPIPVHGKTSIIEHDGKGIFEGIPFPFKAARYHSLIVKINNNKLIITARSRDGIIMGISHSAFPLFGVQFHPESFLTEYGQIIIRNFLKSNRKK
jgi:anthranilate synthase component 2